MGWQVGRSGRHGVRIADRYVLEDPLGVGGQAEVWAARDELTGEPVAVKLITRRAALDALRLRREVAVLRRLRIPGVVKLFDEGAVGDLTFLVMERVQGAPFPGAGVGAPATWEALAGTTLALLETLSRVHAAGIVHRDLKPANVLVDAEGRPTVLDFGISWRTLDDHITSREQILGTPIYMAPEQATGEAVSSRSDLYSVGVMLYEALAGVAPFESASVMAALWARLYETPTPLRERAPSVPARVADLIDRLLQRAPEARPQSAGEVLVALRGAGGALPEGPSLPWIGGDSAVVGLHEAVRQGRSVRLVGPRGCGLTRTLQELAGRLGDEGVRVLWTSRGRAPLESLGGLVELPTEHHEVGLSEVVVQASTALRATLGEGAVLLVDDEDRLDHCSAEVVRACASSGTVVVASHQERSLEGFTGGLVWLGPWTEADLRPLFGDFERLFHLPSDAARALWQRTEGVPARVAEELDAWVHAGFARWDEGALRVDREGLDRIAAGLRLVPPLWHASAKGAEVGRPSFVPVIDPRGSALGRPHLEDVLTCLWLAWPYAKVEVAARALRLPRWKVEASVEELCSLGALRTLSDGRFEPLAPPSVSLAGRTSGRVNDLHVALAEVLGRGDEGRLYHLLAAAGEVVPSDGVVDVAREGVELARRRASEGALGTATAALEDALAAVRRSRELCQPIDAEGLVPYREAKLELLSVWVEVALAEGTPRAMDRALYELARSEATALGRGGAAAPGETSLPALQALVKAALACATDSERALALADALPPFRAPALERCRQSVRMSAVREAPPEQTERVMQALEAWAATLPGDASVQASVAAWRGALAQRQGRFEEAARLHARAASLAPWATDRVAALCDCASAWMEVPDLEAAEEVASRARDLASCHRHVWREADAERVLRCVRYRLGAAQEADLEFVSAVGRLGVPETEARVALTEAAIAWRGGDHALAASLAARARGLWSAHGARSCAAVARGLEVASGVELSDEERDVLAETAVGCRLPGVGVQVLALLARRWPERAPAWRSVARERAEAVRRDLWPVRQEVLSIEEALAGLGA